MIHTMTLSQLAMEFGGTLLYPDCYFDQLSTDTRHIDQGQLFVALRGENFDAHDFLEGAAKNACGLVVEAGNSALEIPQWVVPDTVVALGQIARLNRDQFSGVVVGITGSAGKTTVKEMVAAIFADHVAGEQAVLATRGNLNNHIGVPLTLMELNGEHSKAVIEMGASGPGEIAYLCQVARPQISLVNNVLPAHVAGFGSLDAIAQAKGEIYTGLPGNGIAILNEDQPYSAMWRELIGSRQLITFAVDAAQADVRPLNIMVDDLGRCSFELVTPLGNGSISLAISGRHNVGNALAAASIACAAGVGIAAICRGLNALGSVSGRMELQILADGTRLIDDTYNANPGSVNAAIAALAAIKAKQHILVLGDMAELGDEEAGLHRDVGHYAAEQNISRLLAVGSLSSHTCEGFGAGAQHFDSKQMLIESLRHYMGADTVVLVKGSRSAAMEEVVNTLKQITETGEN